MMVKGVTKVSNTIWGVGECLNVYVQGFIQDFEFREGGRGGTPKFSVDVGGMYGIN